MSGSFPPRWVNISQLFFVCIMLTIWCHPPHRGPVRRCVSDRLPWLYVLPRNLPPLPPFRCLLHRPPPVYDAFTVTVTDEKDAGDTHLTRRPMFSSAMHIALWLPFLCIINACMHTTYNLDMIHTCTCNSTILHYDDIVYHIVYHISLSYTPSFTVIINHHSKAHFVVQSQSQSQSQSTLPFTLTLLINLLNTTELK